LRLPLERLQTAFPDRAAAASQKRLMKKSWKLKSERWMPIREIKRDIILLLSSSPSAPAPDSAGAFYVTTNRAFKKETAPQSTSTDSMGACCSLIFRRPAP
jgi:hypothetical protein